MHNPQPSSSLSPFPVLLTLPQSSPSSASCNDLHCPRPPSSLYLPQPSPSSFFCSASYPTPRAHRPMPWNSSPCCCSFFFFFSSSFCFQPSCAAAATSSPLQPAATALPPFARSHCMISLHSTPGLSFSASLPAVILPLPLPAVGLLLHRRPPFSFCWPLHLNPPAKPAAMAAIPPPGHCRQPQPAATAAALFPSGQSTIVRPALLLLLLLLFLLLPALPYTDQPDYLHTAVISPAAAAAPPFFSLQLPGHSLLLPALSLARFFSLAPFLI
ncbi:hypothetical protein MRB53_002128 [Persea americana]|uniref:Uncharacterized protein n=1 Tax=Persea americana TaxID=3435 RepID=A0ACC2MTP4_PERAE|nr:hypothetical protein MRB53_002128 [Persea americana]